MHPFQAILFLLVIFAIVALVFVKQLKSQKAKKTALAAIAAVIPLSIIVPALFGQALIGPLVDRYGVRGTAQVTGSYDTGMMLNYSEISGREYRLTTAGGQTVTVRDGGRDVRYGLNGWMRTEEMLEVKYLPSAREIFIVTGFANEGKCKKLNARYDEVSKRIDNESTSSDEKNRLLRERVQIVRDQSDLDCRDGWR